VIHDSRDLNLPELKICQNNPKQKPKKISKFQFSLKKNNIKIDKCNFNGLRLKSNPLHPQSFINSIIYIVQFPAYKLLYPPFTAGKIA